jgi:hypothetical protein
MLLKVLETLGSHYLHGFLCFAELIGFVMYLLV